MLDMNVGWDLSLTTTQLNIVLRALRGALRADELQDAQELAKAIAMHRVRVTKNKMNEINKLEDNLNAERPTI